MNGRLHLFSGKPQTAADHKTPTAVTDVFQSFAQAEGTMRVRLREATSHELLAIKLVLLLLGNV